MPNAERKPAAAQARARPAAVPPEVLRLVRRLELRTRGLVNARFAGEYQSVFKGQGMEFAEVREYLPGDEVRSIDWNVTARMRRPFVKRFVEERELTVLLVVDCSGSSAVGTSRRFKRDVAAEVAAAFALLAVRSNDRVGAVLFSEDVELAIPPRKGRRHALRVLRDVLVHKSKGVRTNIAAALTYARRAMRHRSVVFVLSDFVAPAYETQLRLLARRHDVVAVSLEDPGERLLPDIGVARLVDPESGEAVEIDTSDNRVRERFAHMIRAEREARRKLFRRLAVDEIVVRTDRDVSRPLVGFFRARERRRRRG
ncbi:MAG TPA: DUF58 domain-containing protein [Gemmatimonadaceae bacterium]|nr:DUF58 domain-containing protein [Gemmatimonadaceae bacterium]